MTRDELYIKKCIDLSFEAVERGDMPYGSIVVYRNEVISESCNHAHSSGDLTLHAEILVMRDAEKKLGRTDLSDCSIYSSYEPCPMCAFMIRELRFSKVVFSLLSEDMGGYSRYRILQDEFLSNKYPQHFGKVPTIKFGILHDEALKVWDQWEGKKLKP